MAVRRNQKLIPDDDLLALLNRFEAATTVDENNTIHFQHLDHDELERVLPDAFTADPAFTPRQLRYLLREALWYCRKTGKLTNDRLLTEAKRIAKAKLAQSPQRYTMWTKFRARQMAFNKGFRLEWSGVSLESAHVPPRYMRLGEFFLNGYGRIDPSKPAFYGHLITRCAARDEETAVAQMLDATQLFMALFNMYDLFGGWSRGTEHLAEGKLRNGPYHFLFRGKVFLGQEHFWFDTNFKADTWDTFSPDMRDVLHLVPRVRRALVALADHSMRDVLVDVLRLMQNAMASADQSYSLLRYWSALEQLYGDPHAREKNYSRIIQRAIFAERDKVIARWKLGHISRIRNEYVHAGDNDDDLRVMSQYLRTLISRHIHALLFGKDKVRNHRHWLEIVDLPDDESILAERKTVIDQRLEIIRRERRRDDASEGTE